MAAMLQMATPDWRFKVMPVHVLKQMVFRSMCSDMHLCMISASELHSRKEQAGLIRVLARLISGML